MITFSGRSPFDAVSQSTGKTASLRKLIGLLAWLKLPRFRMRRLNARAALACLCFTVIVACPLAGLAKCYDEPKGKGIIAKGIQAQLEQCNRALGAGTCREIESKDAIDAINSVKELLLLQKSELGNPCDYLQSTVAKFVPAFLFLRPREFPKLPLSVESAEERGEVISGIYDYSKEFWMFLKSHLTSSR